MGRRRTKRTSLLSIVVLEVGSLLGIVALAQPSLWETVTGRNASKRPSSSQAASQAASNAHNSSFESASRANVYPAASNHARVPGYSLVGFSTGGFPPGGFSRGDHSPGDFGVVAQQRVDHTAEQPPAQWLSRPARW